MGGASGPVGSERSAHLSLSSFLIQNPLSMNRKTLIQRVATDTTVDQATTKKVLESILHHIQGTLEVGGDVQLIGFGSFSLTERKSRRGINPRTKEPIEIPAKNVVRFKPGKALQEAVNTY